MKRIPITAAKHIAKLYGYDQVIIIARKAGVAPDALSEHVTTYGTTKPHCDSATKQGEALKRFMGWPPGSGPDQVALFAGPLDVRAAVTAPADATHVVKCMTCDAMVCIATQWNVALCGRCIDKFDKEKP